MSSQIVDRPSAVHLTRDEIDKAAREFASAVEEDCFREAVAALTHALEPSTPLPEDMSCIVDPAMASEEFGVFFHSQKNGRCTIHASISFRPALGIYSKSCILIALSIRKTHRKAIVIDK